ncbi:hypothetical protein [Leptospira sp. GIMC2001]|uniref:hypothetical protein n=1 Tax=Leptospira sp. GIMC2001 TaxID=1513297 RepID=UPI00234A834D|nr:hypothetical protein [Leptospira sp. GIMC2001]WCL50996.1 hypothetical protein O4O04_09345 [Leptospira sp. GIMC2001]
MNKLTLQDIADSIGKNKSKISKEIQRNSGKEGNRYRKAHSFTLIRKIIFKKFFRLIPSVLRLIENDYTKISHEKIYKLIYLDKDLGGTLYKHLRQSNKTIRIIFASGKISKLSIKNRVSIMKMDYFVGMGRYRRDRKGGTGNIKLLN